MILGMSPTSTIARSVATAWCIVAWLMSTVAVAHDPGITQAIATVDGARFTVDLTLDLDAIAMDVTGVHDHGETARRFEALGDEERARRIAQATDFVRLNVEVLFDDRPQPFTVTFPRPGEPLPHQEGSEAHLGWTARLEGAVPADATNFALRATAALGTVHLTFVRESVDGADAIAREIIVPGESSRAMALSGDVLPPSSTFDVVVQYAILGLEHIVPKGLDHILFVLGLFLLSAKMRPLLWQVTAFTVAHSITLGLSIYGVVEMPPRIVEPLIALSIAYVAIENLFTSKLTPWRPIVVFCFGLLHGMGFAGVLTELGLPRDEFVPALIAFNVGVEAGQLAVIVGAFLTIGWFRAKPWYRARIVLPLSVAIAAVGLYWAVERVWGG